MTNCRVEMDEDDGLILYEVDFYAGNTEYDYEINAITSAVIKYSSEVKNNTVSTGDSTGSAQQPSSGNSISAEEAKAAAFAHAGVSAANAQKIEVERDMENGMVVYEIEFKSGGMEYSYEINASNGAILSYESEWDD